jgi:hypothetical protein
MSNSLLRTCLIVVDQAHSRGREMNAGFIRERVERFARNGCNLGASGGGVLFLRCAHKVKTPFWRHVDQVGRSSDSLTKEGSQEAFSLLRA